MKLKLSVLFMLSLIIGHSQTITVLEEGTNEPVSGVAIFNLKKDRSVITNLAGKASLELFEVNETIYIQCNQR